MLPKLVVKGSGVSSSYWPIRFHHRQGHKGDSDRIERGINNEIQILCQCTQVDFFKVSVRHSFSFSDDFLHMKNILVAFVFKRHKFCSE